MGARPRAEALSTEACFWRVRREHPCSEIPFYQPGFCTSESMEESHPWGMEVWVDGYVHACLCTLACSVFHACAGIGRSDRYALRGCFARCGAQDPFLCLSGISVKVCLSPAHLTMTSPTHPSSPPHPQPMLKSIYPLTCASIFLPQDLYIPPPTHPPLIFSWSFMHPPTMLHSPSITHRPIHLSIHHPPTHPSIQPSTHPSTYPPMYALT